MQLVEDFLQGGLRVGALQFDGAPGDIRTATVEVVSAGVGSNVRGYLPVPSTVATLDVRYPAGTWGPTLVLTEAVGVTATVELRVTFTARVDLANYVVGAEVRLVVQGASGA